MRILVTGASGFIGGHLANKLVELGHEVVGYDDIKPQASRVKFNSVNEAFQSINDFSSFDAVFHLAAYINVDQSIEDPMGYMLNNTIGTNTLLEQVKRTNPKCKVIYASSAEVYGSARTPIMSEDHPLDPLSPYAVSKLGAEQMCKLYAQLYGMDITVIRNFNTFGEYQGGGLYGGVIAKFKAQGKAGQNLTVYGSGEQMRDYMYIKQAINGYVLALNSKLPTIVNFGSGKPVKIIDIATFIANHYKVGITHTKARPNEIMRLEADISRARQYGYEVSTDFYKNLENYLKYDEI
jgi:nucleoside-diphosphate-sugar epimerase